MKRISILAVVLIMAMTATASALTYKTISALLVSRNINYNGNVTKGEFIVYNDKVYVPLRNFGNITGIETEYKDGEINLKDNNGKIKNDDSNRIPPTGNYIGETKAKEIVLSHAGVKESEATFKKLKLDVDDRRTVYEIEFFAGSKEYEYKIDATTGEIISNKEDTEDSSSNSQNNSTNSYIGNDKAQQIALNDAGLISSQVSSLKTELEQEDSGWEYKVEFKYGEKEYEYKINATTGAIIERRIDND